MATKTWVGEQNYLTQHQSLEDYALKSELDEKLDTSAATATYATKEELSSKADSTAIADMATQTWVTQQNYLTSIPSNYVTDSELTDYAKKSELPNIDGKLDTSAATETYATKTELNGKADSTAISDMATQTWVGQQGYITEIPSNYCKIQRMSQSEYDALTNKDNSTLYIIN